MHQDLHSVPMLLHLLVNLTLFAVLRTQLASHEDRLSDEPVQNWVVELVLLQESRVARNTVVKHFTGRFQHAAASISSLHVLVQIHLRLSQLNLIILQGDPDFVLL